MNKFTKRICLMLSFVLMWNSASYLANAQEAETAKPKAASGQIVSEIVGEENGAEEIEEIDVPDTPVVSEEPGEGLPDNPGSDLDSVVVEKEYIKNLAVFANNVDKSLKLQWEDVTSYDGVEVVLYEKADRSDATPVIIDVTDDVQKAKTGDNGVEVNEVFLDKENMEKELLSGTVYYLDVKAYNNLEDASKAYGKAANAAAVFMSMPVVTMTAGDAKCDLSWQPVEAAVKYEVVDKATQKVILTTEDTKAEVLDLKNDKTYEFQVRAVASVKASLEEDAAEYVFASELSVVASGKTAIVKPAKVTGLAIEPYNLGAILTWNKVPTATKYEIYRYDSKTKKWKSIKKVTGLTYKNTGLTKSREYTYKVRAIREAGGKTATGDFSSTKKITAKAYLTESVHPMYYYARVISKTSLYKESSGSAKAGSLKAGTKVTVLKRAKGNVGRCYVKINGKGYWLARKKLSFYSCKYTSKDYTKQVKERFVNEGGYSSKTNYLIWISSYTQKVNIFKGSKGKWTLYKTYKCATGKPSTSTVQGTYKINKKLSKYGSRTYEKYLSCFYGLTSFHTRLYRNGRIVDSRLSKPITGGCMRMYTDEAKFIYDKMPKNTTVLSF